MRIREATAGEVEAIAELVNRAYDVEHFFVAGDRTSAAGVRRMQETGTFLVTDHADGTLAGCVYTTVAATRGYFGMLAVSPADQKRGIGRALVDAAESRAREAGCVVMDIKVVDLRTDLLRYYDRLEYLVVGTEPYEHRPVIQPCHFVLMEKRLTA